MQRTWRSPYGCLRFSNNLSDIGTGSRGRTEAVRVIIKTAIYCSRHREGRNKKWNLPCERITGPALMYLHVQSAFRHPPWWLTPQVVTIFYFCLLYTKCNHDLCLILSHGLLQSFPCFPVIGLPKSGDRCNNRKGLWGSI